MSESLRSANDNLQFDDFSSKCLLKITEVCDFVGLSRSMIYKCIADPDIGFPTPLKIGSVSRWRKDEIIEWTEVCYSRR